ncbi:MAG: DMT family transporter [Pseudomonadota bacterium]
MNGQWQMVVAMVLSGTIGLFVLGSGQSPLTVVLLRCLIGGAALLAVLAWQRGWRRPDRRALLWIVAGGAALIANWLCLFSAYRYSSISVATVVYHVQPFFLVLLAALLQREVPARHAVSKLALAFAGVALTSGLDLSQRASVIGVLLALAAALLYALATLATRQLKAYPPAQIAGLQLMMGVVVLAPLAHVDALQFDARAALCLLVLGLVHTALMYQLMYAAFQRLRAEAIATLSFIYPLVAMAVDRLAFGTSLSALQWLGMGMILAALIPRRDRPVASGTVPATGAASRYSSD